MKAFFAEKMLDIPVGLTLILVLSTITTYLLFLFAISFATDQRVQRSATGVGILVLLWIIFQSTLSLNNWYMDRKSMHLLFPCITTAVIALVILLLPKIRDWRNALSLRILIAIQLIRIPLEIILWWSADVKQSPASLTIAFGNPDGIIAAMAPIALWLINKKQKRTDKLVLLWNYVGLASLLVLWMRIFFSAPSALQLTSYNAPNYLMVHFPGSWIPSVIIPILLFAHAVVIAQMHNRKKVSH